MHSPTSSCVILPLASCSLSVSYLSHLLLFCLFSPIPPSPALRFEDSPVGTSRCGSHGYALPPLRRPPLRDSRTCCLCRQTGDKPGLLDVGLFLFLNRLLSSLSLAFPFFPIHFVSFSFISIHLCSFPSHVTCYCDVSCCFTSIFHSLSSLSFLFYLTIMIRVVGRSPAAAGRLCVGALSVRSLVAGGDRAGRKARRNHAVQGHPASHPSRTANGKEKRKSIIATRMSSQQCIFRFLRKISLL